MTDAFPTDELRHTAEAMYAFEASGSVPDTGTGSRREGDPFERIIAGFWGLLADDLVSYR